MECAAWLRGRALQPREPRFLPGAVCLQTVEVLQFQCVAALCLDSTPQRQWALRSWAHDFAWNPKRNAKRFFGSSREVRLKHDRFNLARSPRCCEWKPTRWVFDFVICD